MCYLSSVGQSSCLVSSRSSVRIRKVALVVKYVSSPEGREDAHTNLRSVKHSETARGEYLCGGPAPVMGVTHFRDMAQSGRALALGARGRWFESSYPDHAQVVELVYTRDLKSLAQRD